MELLETNVSLDDNGRVSNEDRLWWSYKGLQGLGGGGPQGHQNDGLGVAFGGPTWASRI